MLHPVRLTEFSVNFFTVLKLFTDKLDMTTKNTCSSTYIFFDAFLSQYSVHVAPSASTASGELLALQTFFFAANLKHFASGWGGGRGEDG
jgi:hypothetical protein